MKKKSYRRSATAPQSNATQTKPLRTSLALSKLLIGCVKLYAYLISPLFPASCRFYPSCSHYAIEAIESHGVWHGLKKTVWRLARCHPWHAGGYDPVSSPIVNNSNRPRS